LHDEIDELFERVFGDPGAHARAASGSTYVPAIESFVRNDELVIRADLSGIDPQEVDISVEGDRLTLRGERTSRQVDEERSYREVRYGRFERTMQLPASVDPDTVKAAYCDGVLEITMAAPKGLVAKKVPISVH
jgi:HSP20 family protein